MTADKIKRRADGSIDTAFYMNRGRKMRSEQAHKMAHDGQSKVDDTASRLTSALSRLIGHRRFSTKMAG